MRGILKHDVYLKYIIVILPIICYSKSVCFAIGGFGVIIDETTPVISLLGETEVFHDAGSIYNDEGATAYDNMDGDITSRIVINNSVDVYAVGSYIITYSVQDGAGNSAVEVTRTVNVIDTTPPVITLSGNAEVTLTIGDAFIDFGATALDDIDIDITESIVISGSVDSNTIGNYELHYNVSDRSGNNALELIRVVNVIDKEKYAPVAFDGILVIDEDTESIGLLSAEDENGDALLYSIVENGSKGSVTITDTLRGEFTYSPYKDENGIDSFTFRVNDGLFNSGTATITVTINEINDAPVADAGPDQAVDEKNQVILDGSGSFDIDDGINLLNWRQISGSPVTLSDPGESNPIFTAPDVGPEGEELIFQLTVTDNHNLETTDFCMIYVSLINDPPEQPEPYLPVDGATNISLQPELETHAFFDPDFGDRHVKTKWQISTNSDFFSLVLDRESSKCLVSVVVPMSVLKKDTQYFWRVRFYDEHLVESEWSEIQSFNTLYDYISDENLNSMPGDYNVDSTTDLDLNGLPDVIQKDIINLSNIATQTQIGIKLLTKAAVLESAEIINRHDIVSDDELGIIPFGFIGLKIQTENSGDTASVRIYFSQTIPTGFLWYKYDEISGLVDYSDYAFFSEDRRSVIIELKDGGYGDVDGVKNKIIIDSGGLRLQLADENFEDESNYEEDGTGISMVDKLAEELGSCFIGISKNGLSVFIEHF